MMTSKRVQTFATKTDFREYCKEILNKESKSLRKRAIEKKITHQIYMEIKNSKAQRILIYIPMRTEVNILELIKKIRREKRDILTPFMEHESFRVVKYRLPLQKKKFGIKEPKNSKQFSKKKIDLAIVPILGVDKTGRRVGFGKGMYDRFFEKEQINIKRTIFVSLKLLTNSIKITDEWDISAQKIFSS